MEIGELLRRYSLDYLKIIGEGSFGKVYKAIDHKSRKVVAVKVVPKSKNTSTELLLMPKLINDNIVKLFRNSIDADYVLIIMEYMEGGSLKEYLKSNTVNEAQVINLMKDILQGLVYLHQHNIIHRDIKIDNILLSKNGRAKIADFGLSLQQESFDFSKCKCGTYIYMAPEQLQNKQYAKPVDCWAAGLIMYQLLHQNKHPFWNKSQTKEEFIQTTQLGVVEYSSGISKQARDLMNRLLQVDPTQRYTALQAVEHPIISGKDEVPLSFQEQCQLIKHKLQLLYIFKSMVFIEHLKIPKQTYGYRLGQRGFHVHHVKISIEAGTPVQRYESTMESPIHLLSLHSSTPESTPENKQAHFMRNQKLKKLSLFYEDRTQKKIESPNRSPLRQRHHHQTMSFTQAARDYADLILSQSIQKQKSNLKSPIKLQPIDCVRHKRTSSMITMAGSNN